MHVKDYTEIIHIGPVQIPRHLVSKHAGRSRFHFGVLIVVSEDECPESVREAGRAYLDGRDDGSLFIACMRDLPYEQLP